MPRRFNKLKVVSDGTPFRTHVYDQNGEEIHGVKEIGIMINADGAELRLVIVDFEAQIEGLVKQEDYKLKMYRFGESSKWGDDEASSAGDPGQEPARDAMG